MCKFVFVFSSPMYGLYLCKVTIVSKDRWNFTLL